MLTVYPRNEFLSTPEPTYITELCETEDCIETLQLPELPKDVLCLIFQQLSKKEFQPISLVCKKWTQAFYALSSFAHQSCDLWNLAFNHSLFKKGEYHNFEKLVNFPIAQSNFPQAFIRACQLKNREALQQLINHPQFAVEMTQLLALQLALENNCQEAFFLLIDITRGGCQLYDDLAFRLACRYGHLEIVVKLLNEYPVNPAAKSNEAIRKACSHNHLPIVELLLKNSRVDPADYHNYALEYACKNGHIQVVKCLLQDPRVNPAANANLSILNASTKGHLEIVDILLNDKRVDPCKGDSFRNACKNGFLKVAQLLAQDPRATAAYFEHALELACFNGHLRIVDFLLNQKNIVQKPYFYKTAIELAVEKNHHLVVEKLLTHPRYHLNNDQDNGFIDACQKGYLTIVLLLMNDSRVNPTTNHHSAFKKACENGHIKIIKLLLMDSRIDVAANHNEAFCLAVISGHLSVIDLLLQCPKINPADNENEALMFACQKGRLEIVKRLLKDDRIDATSQNHLAIHLANQFHNHDVADYLTSYFSQLESPSKKFKMI